MTSQQRRVEHGAPAGAGLIERARQRHQAVAGHPAVCRFGPHGARHRGGLANRASRVGAGGQRCLEAGQDRGRTATGPAGDPFQVPRVAGRPIGRVLGRRTHRELVHIGLAEDGHAGGLDPGDDRALVGRHPALENLGAAGGGHARRGHDVLDGDGNTGQHGQLVTGGPACVNGPRGCQGALGVDMQVGMDGRIHLRGALQMRLRDLDRGDLPRGQAGSEFGRAGGDEFVCHGAVLSPARGSGARKSAAGPARARRRGPAARSATAGAHRGG